MRVGDRIVNVNAIAAAIAASQGDAEGAANVSPAVLQIVALVLPDRTNVIPTSTDAVCLHRLGPTATFGIVTAVAAPQLAIADDNRAEARMNGRHVLTPFR